MSDANLDAGARAVFATLADVTAPAKHRLYRATVTEHWVLGPGDERVPMTPG